MRFGRIFFVVVVVICIIEIARLWGITPERMAAHFDIQGHPDRFVPKKEFFWFQIQTLGVTLLISLLPQALFLFIPLELVNMPNREYWLSPERRDETRDRLSSFGAIVFAVILLVIQFVFELSAYANLQTPIYFDAELMIPVIVASLVLIGIILLWLILSFRIPSATASE